MAALPTGYLFAKGLLPALWIGAGAVTLGAISMFFAQGLDTSAAATNTPAEPQTVHAPAAEVSLYPR